MHPIYNNDCLHHEKSLVINYFEKRSQNKRYPHSYQMSMYHLINQAYNYCLLTPKISVYQSPRIQEALSFAIKSHLQQNRKFIDLPYIIHPIEMASRLSAIENITIEQIIAALLHDVVEDCGVSLQEIEKLFGTLIMEHVYQLTDPATKEDGNRNRRLEINFAHFKLADYKTQDIKMTDLISNTRSIIFCDPQFCSVYVPVLEKITEHLQSIAEHLNPSLLDCLIKTTNISRKVLTIQQNFNIVKLDKK